MAHEPHDKYLMFRNRLRKVLTHRRKKAQKQGLGCYRLYDLDLPEFPLAIDLYEDHAHVAEYRRNHGLDDAAHQAWLHATRGVIMEVLGLPADHVHLKQRNVINDRREQYGHFARRGERLSVQEHGLRFLVNLDDYLDTGLFLDHRPTRLMVRELCPGKDVLNLFAYTASFSVYAAAAGARSVRSVDLSHTYLDWARDNFQLNGLDPQLYDFVAADVQQWLTTQPACDYDMIVCDPPTFSNSKKMQGVFDVQRDHPALINHCLRLLRKDGLLLFSTNNRRFKLYDDHLHSTQIRDLTRQTTGFDFDGKLERRCYDIRP